MYTRRVNSQTGMCIIASVFLAAVLPLGAAWAHGPERLLDDGTAMPHLHLPGDPHAAMAAHDAANADIDINGQFGDIVKNLDVAGRGVRLQPDATTDVWTLDGYSYTGTFSSPCGGEPDAGIWVWNVKNPNQPSFVTLIPSPVGSRTNDVKVADMGSGRILVHSNEACADGPGGFEIYNVDDPANPVKLAHVQVDEINPISDALFGGLTDNGVHNLFLFRQGARDYVAAQSEGAFDGFQIFEITDPANPVLVSGWGAEEIFDPGVGDETADVNRVLTAALWLLDGYGASANRFLHDFTISADGTKAYLAHWDAGLILLDISNPASPQLVSVALDPANGSLDGEVNSHAVWPSADGSIVVEGEEDFSAWVTTAPLSGFTFQNRPTNTIPGVGVSTDVGSDFEANQTGNNVTVTATSVTVNTGALAGRVYAAAEGDGSQPKLVSLGGSVTGNAVWIGRACIGDTLLNETAFVPGDVAVVRRGACFFSDKLARAAALGASAIIVSNNLFNNTPWSGLRVWDYSDPANPVLAANINTTCSASPVLIPECDPRGTYSSHNVIVENEGGRVKAYVSWYTDGVLAFDVTDPYMPLETARYHREGPEFEAENGGIQDVWGIYKEPGKPWIYASDRNGGLYVLKEYGWGSAKVAKN